MTGSDIRTGTDANGRPVYATGHRGDDGVWRCPSEVFERDRFGQRRLDPLMRPIGHWKYGAYRKVTTRTGYNDRG